MGRRLYVFKPWMVRALIPEQVVGSYMLYTIDGKRAVPIYCGRSDHDLRRRLVTHPFLRKAAYFDYFVHPGPEQAFINESTLYHLYKGKIRNLIHPAAPNHSHIKCPYCQFAAQIHDFISG